MSSIESQVAAIVLAAGKGTRMKSVLPKVLHPVAGRPMLDWVLTRLNRLGIKKTCLLLSEELSPFADILKAHQSLAVAIQKNRLGTGDAIASAAYAFQGANIARYSAGDLVHGEKLQAEYVLVLAGDVPAIEEELLKKFIESSLQKKLDLAVLGMKVPNPYGYGRLVIDGDTLSGIIEEKDASPEVKAINLCNTGVIFAKASLLFDLVTELTPNNAQGEYYLTDCVRLAYSKGLRTQAFIADEWQQFSGVNDRLQLADLERWMIEQKRIDLMRQGVTLQLPETIYVEPDVSVGADTVLSSHVSLKGQTKIGKFVKVGAGSVLESAVVRDHAVIPPLTVMINT